MRPPILDRPTLVLNKHWQPVRVAPVARALALLWKEQAQVFDPANYQLYKWADWAALLPRDDELIIRGVSRPVRVPEVVLLCRLDRQPITHVPFSRRNIFRRDRWTCQYCGVRPGSEELTLDHVVPRAQGGRSTWENCVLACVRCNARKANRTPAQAGIKLRRLPQRPQWRPLYGASTVRIDSKARFLSEVYWSTPLSN